jgi:hypothetical protein
MNQGITRSLRLMGATVAVAAAIVGFSTTASAPASPALAVATSISPAGQ